jgi:hypothetical protein
MSNLLFIVVLVLFAYLIQLVVSGGDDVGSLP